MFEPREIDPSCPWCSCPVLYDEEEELVYHPETAEVYLCHAGHCAHQQRLRVEKR